MHCKRGCEMWKSKIQNQKLEKNPKPEIRINAEGQMTNAEGCATFDIRTSSFAIDSDFGFRNSDF
jgi:hypothetical protein